MQPRQGNRAVSGDALPKAIVGRQLKVCTGASTVGQLS
jgi:hypothetical protein